MLTDQKAEFIPYLIIWLIVLGAIVIRNLRSHGSGLLLAYCLQLWMYYWLGPFTHALPWSDLPQSDLVLIGFKLCTYALYAFATGCLIIAPLILGAPKPNQQRFTIDPRLPKVYLIAGIVSYVVLVPTVGRISGLTALVAVGGQLITVGLCLCCWQAWNQRGTSALLKWLSFSPLLPALGVITQGFLVQGTQALAVVILFVGSFFRPRWLMTVCLFIAAYVGLTLFVNYMRDREDIRMALMLGEPFSVRAGLFLNMVKTADGINFTNPKHLDALEARMNQVGLVGAAVVHLGDTDDFLKGATIRDAFIGLIPRAIWPGKPMSAGSGDLVSRVTGLVFAEGTSVGIGPVLEFYANFGTWGVVVGFLVLGTIIGTADMNASRHLLSGDWNGFGLWFLFGVCCMQVTGSLFEVTTSAVGSIVVGNSVSNLLRHYQKAHRPGRVAPAAV